MVFCWAVLLRKWSIKIEGNHSAVTAKKWPSILIFMLEKPRINTRSRMSFFLVSGLTCCIKMSMRPHVLISIRLWGAARACWQIWGLLKSVAVSLGPKGCWAGYLKAYYNGYEFGCSLAGRSINASQENKWTGQWQNMTENSSWPFGLNPESSWSNSPWVVRSSENICVGWWPLQLTLTGLGLIVNDNHWYLAWDIAE